MATAVAPDTEAFLFAAPAPAPQAAPQRLWHKLTEPVIFASQDAMRFGARAYTPAQRLVINRAVAERAALSAPRLATH